MLLCPLLCPPCRIQPINWAIYFSSQLQRPFFFFKHPGEPRAAVLSTFVFFLGCSELPAGHFSLYRGKIQHWVFIKSCHLFWVRIAPLFQTEQFIHRKVFSCLLERVSIKKKGKRLGYMQIILNVAKCIKMSSRVSSKLSTCVQRRNNSQQHEAPLEKASWCGDVKQTEPTRWPKGLTVLAPRRTKARGSLLRDRETML